jgi:hypothetical protein
MQYIYGSLAILGFVAGIIQQAMAETVMQQIVGYLSWVIAAIFCVAAEVAESRINQQAIQKRTEPTYGHSGERIE